MYCIIQFCQEIYNCSYAFIKDNIYPILSRNLQLQLLYAYVTQYVTLDQLLQKYSI